MSRNRSNSPLFILVAMIAALAALYLAKQILLPLALAILLSFLLTPLANRIERWRVPRIPAVLLVVAITFGIMGLVGWVVTGQLIQLSHDLPKHRQQIFEKVKAFRAVAAKLEEVGKNLADGDAQPTQPDEPNADRLAQTDHDPRQAAKHREDNDELTLDAPLQPQPQEPSELGPTQSRRAGDEVVPVKVVALPPSPLTQVQTWLGPLVAPLTTAGMIFVLVFFLLIDRENQRNRLIQLFGTANLHATTEAMHEATYRVGRYLRMLFLINATYGFVVAAGLWLIGVPGAAMWGVLGFGLRFLPYLGPWIAALLPIMVSLAVFPGWTQLLLVVGMYVVCELVLNNVAEPLLYGSSVGVTTVGVIVAAIFWTWLWGPVGLVLAMPITVCLVVLARHVPELRFVTVLLADQPPLTPAQRIYQRLLALDYHEPLKLARHHLKSSTLVSFYDEMFIPALILAERDRVSGLLSDDQEQFVIEAAEDLIDELGESVFTAHALGAAAENEARNDAGPDRDAPVGRILCIPLRDEADEIASRMLAQLLSAEGFQVETGAAESLTSEIVDRVAKADCDLVVISILPPIRPRDSRLLWKRLRHRYPDLPIIVGYWIGSDGKTSIPRPEHEEASKVATTLTEAVQLVRSTAAQQRLSKAV